MAIEVNRLYLSKRQLWINPIPSAAAPMSQNRLVTCAIAKEEVAAVHPNYHGD
jgi:hypothetical protein